MKNVSKVIYTLGCFLLAGAFVIGLVNIAKGAGINIGDNSKQLINVIDKTQTTNGSDQKGTDFGKGVNPQLIDFAELGGKITKGTEKSEEIIGGVNIDLDGDNPKQTNVEKLELLYLGDTSNSASITAKSKNLEISNGLIVNGDKIPSDVGNSNMIVIGGGKGNTIAAENAGIVGGSSNKINANDGVIGGGMDNIVSLLGGIVAGGSKNEASIGVVLGGLLNSINGNNGVILGGFLNNSNGDNNLILGKNVNVAGRNNFVWNGVSDGIILLEGDLNGDGKVDVDDYVLVLDCMSDGCYEENYDIVHDNVIDISDATAILDLMNLAKSSVSSNNTAYIGSKNGALIGTYQKKSGVNLVVSGAIRVGGPKKVEKVGGEIIMQDGCFYAYDGKAWHVLGKTSESECGNLNGRGDGGDGDDGISIDESVGTCKFGNAEIQDGDVVVGYTQPVAVNCENVECRHRCVGGEKIDLYVACVEMDAGSIDDSIEIKSCTRNQPYCGDGIVDPGLGEQCDPEHRDYKGVGNCNEECKIVEVKNPECNYKGARVNALTENEELCKNGNMDNFYYDGAAHQYVWTCSNSKGTENCRARKSYCGDGIKDDGEQCDFEDSTHTEWGDGCNTLCERTYEDPLCGSMHNKTQYQDISSPWLDEGSDGLCGKGEVIDFSFDQVTGKYQWQCQNGNKQSGICTATQQYCGDGLQNGTEQCDDGVNNGKIGSSCSSTCTPVTAPLCGTQNGKSTYFSQKQTLAWLTKTSEGMCGEGFIMAGTPSIVGTDSHLEWSCSNSNGSLVQCKAYQQYCGDGTQNGTEQCDVGVNNGKENSSCSSTCTTVVATPVCNVTYHEQIFPDLQSNSNLCTIGTISEFKYNSTSHTWTWKCKNSTITTDCSAEAGAYLVSGDEFVKQVKDSIGGRHSMNMKKFMKGSKSSMPSNKKTISTSSSKYPVYIWHSNGIVYYYTDAKKIFMNQNSSKMFADFENLESVDLSDFDTSRVTNMSYMFRNNFKLKNLSVSNFDTSKVTNMSYMFGGCKGLTSIDLSNFDTSEVTNMKGMFSDCYSLTSIDVSNFDTSKVMDMSYMFGGCESLTSIDLSNFDTSQVIYMGGMFNYCHVLKTIYVGYNFTMDNLNDNLLSTLMFSDDYVLKGGYGTLYNIDHASEEYARIDCGLVRPGYFTSTVGYDSCPDTPVENTESYYPAYLEYGGKISNDMETLAGDVKNIEHFTRYTGSDLPTNKKIISEETSPEVVYMWYDNSTKTIYYYTKAQKIYLNRDVSDFFDGFSKLESVDTSGWDTSQVIYMSRMFSNCSRLNNLDVSKWDTSKVKSMYAMFLGCSSLDNLDVSGWDTSRVTDMSYMFFNCSNLTSLDLSKWSSYLSSIEYMFYGCSSLTSLDLSGLKTSSVAGMQAVFRGCSSLQNIVFGNGWDTSRVTDMTYMFYGCSSLTSLDLSKFNTNKVQYTDNMFYGCSSLTSLDLSTFEVPNVERTMGMFEGCSSLTSLDLSKFKTSKVFKMDSMFQGCSNLQSIKFSSNFKTTKVQSMYNMFYGCSSLTSLDLSEFDTSRVSEMNGMFRGCSSLTSLDLSKFNTSRVSKMYGMFFGDSNLKTIYVSESFNVDSVNNSNSKDMFGNCESLVGGNGTTYDQNYVDKTYARIDKSGEPGYFTKK